MARISRLFATAIIITTALATATNLSVTADDPSGLQAFKPEAIKQLNDDMHKWVDGGKGSCMVTLLAHKGKIVNFDAYGYLSSSDKSEKNRVQKDSLFNIMSMTKPISGVAMMTFYDEGKFQLDDLVSKHIPSFADLKVGGNAPQNPPMTMRHLLSHSAGFPANMVATGATLKAGVEALAKSNLAFQPGTDWRYGPGVEIQGYLMEKWAGKDVAEIYQDRIFGPLGMNDTNFWVPAEKKARVVRSSSAPPAAKPARLVPSYGLHATAEDYFRMGQMLLNGGTYNGKRILKPETVQLMRTNVLDMDKGVYVKFMGGGKGVGFGLDFAVVVDPAPTKNYQPKGTFFWGGAYGTWFWIDPTNEVVFVGMVSTVGQGLSGDSSLRQLSAKSVYEGLIKK